MRIIKYKNKTLFFAAAFHLNFAYSITPASGLLRVSNIVEGDGRHIPRETSLSLPTDDSNLFLLLIQANYDFVTILFLFQYTGSMSVLLRVSNHSEIIKICTKLRIIHRSALSTGHDQVLNQSLSMRLLSIFFRHDTPSGTRT